MFVLIIHDIDLNPKYNKLNRKPIAKRDITKFIEIKSIFQYTVSVLKIYIVYVNVNYRFSVTGRENIGTQPIYNFHILYIRTYKLLYMYYVFYNHTMKINTYT